MAKIVLIDDNHGPMDLYVQALCKSGYEMQHLDTVALALAHIDNAEQSADLYILDIMMPPGDALDLRESSFGLTSGILIYERLLKRFPGVPVIVLTNISAPEILEHLPLDDPRTTREAKIDVLPFDLVEKVRQRLNPNHTEG